MSFWALARIEKCNINVVFSLICIAFFCGVQALAFIWVSFHSPNCCLGAAKINLIRRLKLLKKLHCPGQFQVATPPPTL